MMPPSLPAHASAGWAAPVYVPGAHTRAGNAMSRTRQGLLAGALRAFADQGVRRSTMQSVAVAAGVAKATLYNHFRTKDDVIRALLAAELDRLTTLAAELPLEAALVALSDELGGHPVLRRLIGTEPDVLTALLAVGNEQWSHMVGRLASALGVPMDGAELIARWLLGVVLQPGRSTTRRRAAVLLVAAIGSVSAGA
jgi:AcrR family transcriptional regulator